MATKINEFYSFAGYKIEKKQIIQLVVLIMKSRPVVITEEYFNEFIELAKSGEFGMIYSSPISFMVAFKVYNEKNTIPVFHSGPDR